MAAYIHRVGRTARYLATGRALLLLTPSEKEGMLSALEDAKVPLKLLKHNPAKMQPVGPALQALLSKDAELKAFAQGALVSYVRSVYLQPNKAVFDVTKLPVDEIASSMGLLAAPKLRFLRRAGKKVVEEVVVGGGGLEAAAGGAGAGGAEKGGKEGASGGQRMGGKRKRQEENEEEEEGEGDGSEGAEEEEGEEEQQQQQREANGKQGKAKGAAATAAAAAAARIGEVGGDEEEDFLVLKTRNVFDAPEAGEELQQQAEAAAAAAAGGVAADGKQKKRKKQKIKVGGVSSARTVFDEEGNAVDPLELLATSGELGRCTGEGEEGAEEDQRAGVHVVADAPDTRFRQVAALMRSRDREDKAAAAALRKAMRSEKRAKRKAKEQGEDGPIVALGAPSSEGGEAGGSSGSDDEEAAAAAPRGARGRKRQAGGGSGAGGSSSDDERVEAPTRAPVARPDVAHMGMQRRAGGEKGGAESGTAGVGLSLQRQEELALSLLRARG